MLHSPSFTVVGLPPCARTMPAARLLAPMPTSPCSSTITRFAPRVREKYDAHPPTVPAPTTTRSAVSFLATRAPPGLGTPESSPGANLAAFLPASFGHDLELAHAGRASGADSSR